MTLLKICHPRQAATVLYAMNTSLDIGIPMRTLRNKRIVLKDPYYYIWLQTTYYNIISYYRLYTAVSKFKRAGEIRVQIETIYFAFVTCYTYIYIRKYTTTLTTISDINQNLLSRLSKVWGVKFNKMFLYYSYFKWDKL